MPDLRHVDDAPYEIAGPIKEFWPSHEWNNAASIAFLESNWQWDAETDTTDTEHPCGTVLEQREGITITAEHSIGYFQINVCNYPEWNPAHFFNARQNAGSAHALWSERGWLPWYFSAIRLGLLPKQT